MFRVAITFKDKQTPLGKNFETKEEADLFILELAEKEKISTVIIQNKETKKREILHF